MIEVMRLFKDLLSNHRKEYVGKSIEQLLKESKENTYIKFVK
jgi:hypothetical protein